MDTDNAIGEVGQRRFDQSQYDLLRSCSAKKDLSGWNEWRRQNPNVQVLLEGANLQNAFLDGANLAGAILCPEYDLSGKDFVEKHKDKLANLEGARLSRAQLQRATLNGAKMKGVVLSDSCMENANLIYADLSEAMLLRTKLRGSMFEDARLRGADISRCDLRNANFRVVVVDEVTAIWKPLISPCRGPWKPEERTDGDYAPRNREYTDFQGVPLDSIRIDPGSRQLLEYNIRRRNWEQWHRTVDWQDNCVHKRHWVTRIVMWPIMLFWWVSDYGRRTGRIILCFIALWAAFGTVYSLWPHCITLGHANDNVALWRVFYAALVMMISPDLADVSVGSWPGGILLAFQAVLSYVLLAILITRLAVLFGGGGPSAKFHR